MLEDKQLLLSITKTQERKHHSREGSQKAKTEQRLVDEQQQEKGSEMINNWK